MNADSIVGVWYCRTTNPNGTVDDSIYTFRPDKKLYLDNGGYLITGSYSILDSTNVDTKYTHIKSGGNLMKINYEGELVVQNFVGDNFSFDITTHTGQTNTRSNVCSKRV